MLYVNKLLCFEYTRGESFSVVVSINPITDSMTYHKEKYPKNCAVEVKRAFLEEAEKAAMIELMKLEDGVANGM